MSLAVVVDAFALVVVLAAGRMADWVCMRSWAAVEVLECAEDGRVGQDLSSFCEDAAVGAADAVKLSKTDENVRVAKAKVRAGTVVA